DPQAAEGDLYSLAACNEAGLARLLETLDEFDLDGLDAVGATIIENSRAAMLEEVRKVPFGRYEYAMRIDGYDAPVDLVVAVTVG
ncbi:hydantoinase B/oxoprolinase family protein, partial [Flavonifractor plautii]|uniref:hydantoinase B/oxoprolinase family protein n=1 Tax=Flavonifractor plautii TaxID=292800 RepID=UPI003D7D2067